MGKQSAFVVACLNFRELCPLFILATVHIWRPRFLQMCLFIASVHKSAFFFRKSYSCKRKVD